MSQSSSQSLGQPANRLTIAHLLLWVGATALVLTCTERIWRFELHLLPPDAPSIDSVIGFDGPASAEAEHRVKMRMSIRREIRLACVALSFAPVYGAVLSLTALAAWRVVTLRSYRSLQPGHWLVIAVSVAILIVGSSLAGDWNRTLNSDVPGLPLFGLAALVLLLGAVCCRDSRRWPLALCAAGAGSIGFAWVYWLELQSTGPLLTDLVEVLNSPPRLFLMAGIAGGATAAAIDVVSGVRRGLEHWIGVAMTFLAIGHWIIELAFDN